MAPSVTHGEMSSSCATATTSSSASSTRTTPSGFWANCGRGFTDSTWNCTLRRRGSSSLGALRSNGVRGGVRGNRRPSTFSALRTCAAKQEGQVYGPAQDHCQTATQETPRGQADPAAAYALAHPAARGLAAKRVAWALPVLCGPSQQQSAHVSSAKASSAIGVGRCGGAASVIG